MLGISKSTTPLLKTIEDIKEELQVLLDKNATKIENISNVQIYNLTEDEIVLLKKEIRTIYCFYSHISVLVMAIMCKT